MLVAFTIPIAMRSSDYDSWILLNIYTKGIQLLSRFFLFPATIFLERYLYLLKLVYNEKYISLNIFEIY
jgi:hypothetical protein